MDSSSRETASFSEGSTRQLSPCTSGSLFRLLDPAIELSISRSFNEAMGVELCRKPEFPRKTRLVPGCYFLRLFREIRPRSPGSLRPEMPGQGTRQAGFFFSYVRK